MSNQYRTLRQSRNQKHRYNKCKSRKFSKKRSRKANKSRNKRKVHQWYPNKVLIRRKNGDARWTLPTLSKT